MSVPPKDVFKGGNAMRFLAPALVWHISTRGVASALITSRKKNAPATPRG